MMTNPPLLPNAINSDFNGIAYRSQGLNWPLQFLFVFFQSIYEFNLGKFPTELLVHSYCLFISRITGLAML